MKVGRLLDDLDYLWFEDPIRTTDLDGLVELAAIEQHPQRRVEGVAEQVARGSDLRLEPLLYPAADVAAHRHRKSPEVFVGAISDQVRVRPAVLHHHRRDPRARGGAGRGVSLSRVAGREGQLSEVVATDEQQ